jgi:hypothetical protein
MNKYWQLKQTADSLEATRIKKQADCEAVVLEARQATQALEAIFTNRRLTRNQVLLDSI